MAGDPIVGLGAAGDSLTDEYSESSFFETYQYAKSWMQLVGDTGVFTGEPGPYSEPRRSGTAFNWARWGATSGDLLAAKQHTWLAQQGDVGRVTHAVLAVGQNDFNPYIGSQYSNIYNGRWSTAQINSYVNQVVGNITTALTTLANSNARVVISNILDPGAAPQVRSAFPHAARRDRVTAVIDTVNARLTEVADQWNVPLADLNGLAEYFFGTNRSRVSSRQIGGVTVTNTAGSGVTNAFVHDGLHPHTMVQAQLANLFLEGFKQAYDTPVDQFSEAETVALVGRTYGGHDTLNIDFADYVRMFNNAAPVLSGIESVTYTENAAPVLLAPGATVTDADKLNFSQGTLRVDYTGASETTDVLAIQHQGTDAGQIGLSGVRVLSGGVEIGRYSGGLNGTPLVIEFNAKATAETVQAVARSITFENTSENPSTIRDVSFTLTDGDGGVSPIVAMSLEIIAENDAPVLSGVSGSVTYTENAPPVALAPSTDVAVSDADHATFAGGSLQVAIVSGAATPDRLLIRNQRSGAGLIQVSGSSVLYGVSADMDVEIGTFAGGVTGSLVVSLNENASPAAVRALVRNIVFRTFTENPTETPRQVEIVLTDPLGAASPTSEVTVDVVAVNDAPRFLTGVTGEAHVSYTRDASPITLLAAATITDPDSANFEGGQLLVSIDGGDGSEQLDIGSGFSLSGDDVVFNGVIVGTRSAGTNSTDLVVQFNDKMTAPIAQRLVRAINFRTSGATSLASRLVSFTISDGDGGLSSAAVYVDLAE